jgi:hypothetical protein
MKRAQALIIALVMMSGTVSATATMGVYFEFDAEKTACSPAPFTAFTMYLYVRHAEHYVTAVEYSIVTPGDPGHALFSITEVRYPDGESICDGDPFSGHTIAYWPPLNGFMPGYNLLCSFTCTALEPCWNAGGAMVDYEIVVGPHPESGWLRGTFAPDNQLFDIVGLTSKLCPEEPGDAGGEGWGAAKSLYR